jgi:PadR family transcriptional regulator PadR
MGKPNDLAPGGRNLLLLKTASLEPKHGWATAKRIQQIRAEVLPLQQASLYPAFDRRERRGTDQGQLANWAKWRETETGRQAKFYSLTAAGALDWERKPPTGAACHQSIWFEKQPRRVMLWYGPADSGSAYKLCSAATGAASD